MGYGNHMRGTQKLLAAVPPVPQHRQDGPLPVEIRVDALDCTGTEYSFHNRTAPSRKVILDDALLGTYLRDFCVEMGNRGY